MNELIEERAWCGCEAQSNPFGSMHCLTSLRADRVIITSQFESKIAGLLSLLVYTFYTFYRKVCCLRLSAKLYYFPAKRCD